MVGSLNVDQFTYCERFPGDGETLVAGRYAQGFGGKGANQAVMAARLGAGVAMVGCVGDDDLGRATRANLTEHGIDPGGVVAVAGPSTGVATIWVDDTGANRILVVTGANASLTADHVTAALTSTRAHVVVAQLETPQDATAAAFALGPPPRRPHRPEPCPCGRRRPRGPRPGRLAGRQRERVRCC